MKILTNGQYYGQKKKELHVNGVILSEYSYDIPKMDWHYHENPYFMYLLQGQMYDVNKKEKSTCSSGDLLFHNWQEKPLLLLVDGSGHTPLYALLKKHDGSSMIMGSLPFDIEQLASKYHVVVMSKPGTPILDSLEAEE